MILDREKKIILIFTNFYKNRQKATELVGVSMA